MGTLVVGLSGSRHGPRRMRRDRSRSRSRPRRDRKRPGGDRDARKSDQPSKEDGSSASLQPPQDWRGPVGGPPPQDWRGPVDYTHEWRGPPGPHAGPYPGSRLGDLRWYADRPPPRPMSFPPPMPGPYSQRPMPPPNGQMRAGPEGWHAGVPPRPDDAGRYRSEPPVEWRGPMGLQPPAYGPRGPVESTGDMWASRSPSATGLSSGHWGAGPPGDASAGYPGAYQQPPLGFGLDGHGGEPDKPFDTAAVAVPAAEGQGAGAGAALPAHADAVPPASAGGGGVGTNAEDGEDGEDALPMPQTVAKRLRGVRVVRSALSERMLTRLRAAGVLVDGQPSHRPSVTNALDDAGASVEAPVAAAAAHSRCTRLGLDNGSAQRARLPPPTPGPSRLPACTIGLSHAGLWERFRTKCGTPVPAETPPIPCELRTSRGGGHVVVPLVIPATLTSS